MAYQWFVFGCLLIIKVNIPSEPKNWYSLVGASFPRPLKELDFTGRVQHAPIRLW